MNCPKCGEKVLIQELNSGWFHCHCGKEWRETPFTPYNKLTTSGSYGPSHNQKGSCSNCKRDKQYANRKLELCWMCNKAVKGLEVGSELYSAKLAETKTRIQSVGFKEYNSRFAA